MNISTRNSCSVTSCGVPSVSTAPIRPTASSPFLRRSSHSGPGASLSLSCGAVTSGKFRQLAPGRLQRQIERRCHRLMAGADHQRRRDIGPVLDERPQLVGSKKHLHVIERARHPLSAEQEGHQSRRRAIGLHDIPLPVGDDGRKRLVTPQQQIDRAPGVIKLGRGQIALAILPGKAAGLQQRVAVAQRQSQRRGKLQQDVAAGGRLAGFDIAQMLDGNAGFKCEIGLAHGAAIAPAAQEVADRMRAASLLSARANPCRRLCEGASPAVNF